MAIIQANLIDDLRSYLQGVLGRADHHAHNVDQVVIPLIGAVVAFAEPNSIELYAQNGDVKNVLWAQINGTRYAFSYDHLIQRIVTRCGTTRGRIVATFNNTTTVQQVMAIFRAL